METRYGKQVGWRTWRVRFDPFGNPVMFGLYRQPWDESFLQASHPEGHAMRSRPLSQSQMFQASKSKSVHQSPHSQCTCGIYVEKLDADNLDRWRNYGAQGEILVAEGPVEFWGDCFEGETGWRAQFAQMRGPMILKPVCRPPAGVDRQTGWQPPGEICKREPTIVQRCDYPSVEHIVQRPLCEVHQQVRGLGEIHCTEQRVGTWLQRVMGMLESKYEVPFTVL
jgi:hypothetical protein